MEDTIIRAPDAASDQRGVSNTTVAVLVMLALLMTFIGTWAVLNNINTVKEEASSSQGGGNIGRVSFTIVSPPGVVLSNNGATALVTLNIQKG